MTTLLHPSFTPSPTTPNSPPNSPPIQSLIQSLNLLPHIEGGHFIETDRDPSLVPSPFPSNPTSTTTDFAPQRPGFVPDIRNASTTIYYLLTPSSPQGGFHRNAGRTVHTLHHGRGRYVLINSSGTISSFTVGPNIAAGEKLQWIVEGGLYKASFLLPDSSTSDTDSESKGGLLISETVVPGFEYCDHDFLTRDGLSKLVGEKKRSLEWLLSPLAK